MSIEAKTAYHAGAGRPQGPVGYFENQRYSAPFSSQSQHSLSQGILSAQNLVFTGDKLPAGSFFGDDRGKLKSNHSISK